MMARISKSFRSSFGLLGVAALCCVAWGRPATAAGPRRDVQLIGLAPLYEALFAVANCPGLALDQPAFRRAAGLYHLTPVDLTPGGAFAPEIAALADHDRIRLDNDRGAFCDAARLQFAVPYGILVQASPPPPPTFSLQP